MSLYRVVRRYSNGTIKLTTDQVVDLDDETAAFVERDSAGVLQALNESENAQIEVGMALLSVELGVPLKANWQPAAAEPHLATGDGGAMHSGNMIGLVKR